MLFNIVGTGRCGSTLLRDMLDRHPDVFVCNESHWIPKMFECFGTGTGPAGDFVEIVLRTYHVTGKRVVPCGEAPLRALFAADEEISVAEFCGRLGLALAGRAGKRQWADKTPDYGPYMGMLQTIWPACRFIHVIRNELHVTRSMSRHPGYRWLAAARETWWVPASFNGYYRAVEEADVPLEAFAALCGRRLRRIRDESRRLRQGSFLEIRFEHLLERPAETLLEVASFVGLPAPEAWLRTASALADPTRPASGGERGL